MKQRQQSDSRISEEFKLAFENGLAKLARLTSLSDNADLIPELDSLVTPITHYMNALGYEGAYRDFQVCLGECQKYYDPERLLQFRHSFYSIALLGQQFEAAKSVYNASERPLVFWQLGIVYSIYHRSDAQFQWYAVNCPSSDPEYNFVVPGKLVDSFILELYFKQDVALNAMKEYPLNPIDLLINRPGYTFREFSPSALVFLLAHGGDLTSDIILDDGKTAQQRFSLRLEYPFGKPDLGWRVYICFCFYLTELSKLISEFVQRDTEAKDSHRAFERLDHICYELLKLAEHSQYFSFFRGNLSDDFGMSKLCIAFVKLINLLIHLAPNLDADGFLTESIRKLNEGVGNKARITPKQTLKEYSVRNVFRECMQGQKYQVQEDRITRPQLVSSFLLSLRDFRSETCIAVSPTRLANLATALPLDYLFSYILKPYLKPAEIESVARILYKGARSFYDEPESQYYFRQGLKVKFGYYLNSLKAELIRFFKAVVALDLSPAILRDFARENVPEEDNKRVEGLRQSFIASINELLDASKFLKLTAKDFFGSNHFLSVRAGHVIGFTCRGIQGRPCYSFTFSQEFSSTGWVMRNSDLRSYALSFLVHIASQRAYKLMRFVLDASEHVLEILDSNFTLVEVLAYQGFEYPILCVLQAWEAQYRVGQEAFLTLHTRQDIFDNLNRILCLFAHQNNLTGFVRLVEVSSTLFNEILNKEHRKHFFCAGIYYGSTELARFFEDDVWADIEKAQYAVPKIALLAVREVDFDKIRITYSRIYYPKNVFKIAYERNDLTSFQYLVAKSNVALLGDILLYILNEAYHRPSNKLFIASLLTRGTPLPYEEPDILILLYKNFSFLEFSSFFEPPKPLASIALDAALTHVVSHIREDSLQYIDFLIRLGADVNNPTSAGRAGDYLCVHSGSSSPFHYIQYQRKLNPEQHSLFDQVESRIKQADANPYFNVFEHMESDTPGMENAHFLHRIIAGMLGVICSYIYYTFSCATLLVKRIHGDISFSLARYSEISNKFGWLGELYLLGCVIAMPIKLAFRLALFVLLLPLAFVQGLQLSRSGILVALNPKRHYQFTKGCIRLISDTLKFPWEKDTEIRARYSKSAYQHPMLAITFIVSATVFALSIFAILPVLPFSQLGITMVPAWSLPALAGLQAACVMLTGVVLTGLVTCINVLFTSPAVVVSPLKVSNYALSQLINKPGEEVENAPEGSFEPTVSPSRNQQEHVEDRSPALLQVPA